MKWALRKKGDLNEIQNDFKCINRWINSDLFSVLLQSQKDESGRKQFQFRPIIRSDEFAQVIFNL